VPLSCSEAVVALCEGLNRHIVFLFDEFDDPFARLDGRVFLNLRALRDKYGPRLCFVTATGTELAEQCASPEASEFCELFAENVIRLTGLDQDEARYLVQEIGRAAGVELDDEEVRFVWQQAGGHMGLLQAVTTVLIRVAAGAPASLRKRSLMITRQQLDSDEPVRVECSKLCNELTAEDRQALLRFLASG